MKLRNQKIALAVMCLTAFANFSKAQAPATLEMTSTGFSNTALGPSTAPVAVTLRQDSLNATFNTLFKPYNPPLTVTFSFANQQFNTVYGNLSSGMCFGGGNTGSTGGATQQSATNPIYNVLGATLVQPPQNGMFVSSPTGTIVPNWQAGGRGVGLDPEGTQNGTDLGTGSFDLNFGTSIFTTVEPLWDLNLPANGRYYYGDLVITFSRPVQNPVLHFGGLGGSYNYQPISGGPRLISYFSTELELNPIGGSSSSYMAGNEFFSVTPTGKILNTSPTPNGGSYDDGGTQGGFLTYGAATGSARLNGVYSQLVYKVYVRGSASSTHNWSQNMAAISGATRDPLNGDLFYVGVSMQKPCTTAGGSGCGTTPITLTNFSAVKSGANALLTWQTAQEINSKNFDIQYSKDGVNWQSIGIVNAAGFSSSTKSYSFVHTTPVNGMNFYRLKQVDQDAKFEYSVIRTVNFNTKTSITLMPNPTVDKLYVIGNSGGSLQSVTLFSADGKQVQTTPNFLLGNSIDMRSFAPGIYTVKIIQKSGFTEVMKVVKQ